MEKEKGESTTTNVVGDGRRRLVTASISALLLETGFNTVEPNVLEILTEMLQCCEYIKF